MRICMKQEPSIHKMHTHVFIKKLVRNSLIGLGIIAGSLSIGMWGYHHFERMSWVDSYVNAAMILSGMGPVSNLQTTSGKIFAGTYALFSGIVFLIFIAIIFAPIFHRFMHELHLPDDSNPSPK